MKYKAYVKPLKKTLEVAVIDFVSDGLNVGVLTCNHKDCKDCIAYFDFEQVELKEVNND